MKIGIIGSRGIPNEYGGFEQFAEYLSTGLIQKNCQVWVYTSDSNSFKQNQYKGVQLIHCFDPEKQIGPFGQFLYDLNCILDSRKRNFDIILQLGYTSSAIWNGLFDKKVTVVTNTDGMEWQRSKYNRVVRRFLKYSEKTVVSKSNYLISDSRAIKKHIESTYNRTSVFIPYGATVFTDADQSKLLPSGLKAYEYFLVIARFQPDNNIETIIQGHMNSKTKYPLIIVGNLNNRFANKLKDRYSSDSVRFTGGIYKQTLLNNLRYFSTAYFHGHSAGGTNPSLLEAMAASAFICAHDNIFNREVLGNDSNYFKDTIDVTRFIDNKLDIKSKKAQLKNNIMRVKTIYSTDEVIDRYYEFFNQVKKSKLTP